MNILYLITDLGLGGAEVLLVNLANEMKSRGHHVEIFVLGETNAHADSINPGVIVHHARMQKSLSGVINAVGKLRNLSKTRSWNVMHAHMFHANIVARLARKFFPSAQLISTAHSNNEGGRARMLAYRATDFLSDLNTNVSTNALQRYIALGAFTKSKSGCVYNFVNTDLYRKDPVIRETLRRAKNIGMSDFTILSVGRLVPEKNQALLLNAVALLVPAYPSLRLFLIGDGVERANLELLSRTLGIEQSVQFCGAQRNTAEWYSFADLFVLSSNIEGFGLVLAEAMACECPAIATDVGGCAEVIGDADCLVPAGHIERLRMKIESFLQMSVARRVELGHASRARVLKRFDQQVVVGQWERLYADANHISAKQFSNQGPLSI